MPWVCADLFVAFGHAVQAEGVEEVERRMGEHESSPSMEVAGAAQVGMVDHRRGLGLALGAIEVVGEDGGEALVGERADRDSPGRDRFRRAGSSPRNSRRIPRQVRKPCSGWGRALSTAMTSPSVFGPIERAQRWKRPGVHSA